MCERGVGMGAYYESAPTGRSRNRFRSSCRVASTPTGHWVTLNGIYGSSLPPMRRE